MLVTHHAIKCRVCHHTPHHATPPTSTSQGCTILDKLRITIFWLRIQITILSHDFQYKCLQHSFTEGTATKNMKVPDIGWPHQLWTIEREHFCFQLKCNNFMNLTLNIKTINFSLLCSLTYRPIHSFRVRMSTRVRFGLWFIFLTAGFCCSASRGVTLRCHLLREKVGALVLMQLMSLMKMRQNR